MKHALKEAGVALPPLTKRIWLWLKDHPAQTYKSVSAALGESESAVSSTLTGLVKRGMLTTTQDTVRGSMGVRGITRYTVKHKEYELLPKPLKHKPLAVVGLRPGPMVSTPAQTQPVPSDYEEFKAFQAFLAMKARAK